MSAPAMPKRGKAKKDESGEKPNYGSGSVKIAPDLAFKARMVAEFRGVSIADLLDKHLRPFVESNYTLFLKDANKIKVDQPPTVGGEGVSGG